MLIRFATKKEIEKLDIEEVHEFSVIVATDRRSNKILGFVTFDADRKMILKSNVFDLNKDKLIKEKLLKCANNQINPIAKSFHYNYRKFNEQSLEKNCPVCNSAPMPDGLEDLHVFDHTWVVAEPKAQGRLFGKCVVGSKFHNVHFYDLSEQQMIQFMSDVQKVAKALHKVTGSIKINYEIHGNSGPHLHCHLFPRYLDDDFPSAPIDYRINEPSPYEDMEEYEWFISEMRKELIV